MKQKISVSNMYIYIYKYYLCTVDEKLSGIAIPPDNTVFFFDKGVLNHNIKRKLRC
jgi:hypothetical protein